jgi:hypothetical protein
MKSLSPSVVPPGALMDHSSNGVSDENKEPPTLNEPINEGIEPVWP